MRLTREIRERCLIYSIPVIEPFRLAFGLVAAFLVWMTPYVITGGHVPAYYFIGLIALYLIHQVTYTRESEDGEGRNDKRE